MARQKTLSEEYAQIKEAELDAVKFKYDAEEEYRKKNEEARMQSTVNAAEHYKKVYAEADSAINKRAAELKDKSAEKAAKKAFAVDQKYDKKKQALQSKLDQETDADKKAALQAEIKAVDAAHSKKLKNIQEEFVKEQENAETLAAFQEKLGGLGKAGEALSSLIDSAENGTFLQDTTSAIADFATSLKGSINEIAGFKTSIDTRLQGSKNSTKGGSYWDQISKDITGAAGISPLVKQSEIASKVQSMVNSGIAYNVEQRAFLSVVSEKIATTFNETNSSLARLVRIQQDDSTAARLGMESALNEFLNNMYETTEYMSSVMSGIRSSLEEAEALMTKESATSFDYQVNKWLGSMYSVGVSSEAVQSIGSVLGQIASGQISGITGDGAGNLVVMAASNAGLSISDMLQEGLDESQTNQLMAAMVQYLKGIYEDTNDSLVVAQQYANVFGLKASDLKAIANLSNTDVYNTAKSSLSYSGALTQLSKMANSMYSRTSQGELMTNLTDNFKYTMAAGIANNAVLYSMYTLADVLDSTVGGIDFSLPLVMGSGTAQTFNVADILKTGALSGSIISGIASMLGSAGNGGITGDGLLKAFGVGTSASVSRGSGTSFITSSGETTSSSGYIGNSSYGDVYSKSMTDTQDSVNQQTVEAEESSTEATNTDINNNVVLIYDLLKSVTDGSMSLKVDMGDSSAWTQALSSSPSY